MRWIKTQQSGNTAARARAKSRTKTPEFILSPGSRGYELVRMHRRDIDRPNCGWILNSTLPGNQNIVCALTAEVRTSACEPGKYLEIAQGIGQRIRKEMSDVRGQDLFGSTEIAFLDGGEEPGQWLRFSITPCSFRYAKTSPKPAKRGVDQAVADVSKVVDRVQNLHVVRKLVEPRRFLVLTLSQVDERLVDAKLCAIPEMTADTRVDLHQFRNAIARIDFGLDRQAPPNGRADRSVHGVPPRTVRWTTKCMRIRRH